jgi:phosphatidate cytidylyltransferase
MLKTRILSALVLAPPVLAALWLGGVWFVALMALAGLLLGREWDKLCEGRFGPAGVVLAVEGVAVPVLGASWVSVAVIVVAAILAWYLAHPSRRTWLAAGSAYIGIPLMALVWLSVDGRATLLWVVLLVWATDIGAYAAGRTIGGPKLAPRISPGKTWAGLGGGMASAAVLGSVVGLVAGGSGLALALLSAVLAVVAQAGDLTESWVKRHFGVKDSGVLIPGHGGLFDRVDGLLTAAPVAALLLLAFGNPVP